MIGWGDDAWVSAGAEAESIDRLLAEIRTDLGPATEDETSWARDVVGVQNSGFDQA